MICLVVNCQYAFRLSVIVLGELPVFPPRFDKVPLNLRGVQEGFGRVMPAVTEFTLISHLLAFQEELRPGNRAEPFGPDPLFAVRTGAVLANVQSVECFFDHTKPARRAVKIANGKFARHGSLNLIHRVRCLLDAHLVPQAQTLSDVSACVFQLFLHLQLVELRRHGASPLCCCACEPSGSPSALLELSNASDRSRTLKTPSLDSPVS